MTFMESAIAMNADFIECHNDLNKTKLFAEASYNQYEINLKEIALKVFKENGTEDDYNFLATEAAKDYIERAKKSISKVIKTIAKFIKDQIDKLVSLFTSAKTSKALDKLEEACEKNPKLRSKKIEYENTDKKVKALQKGIDDVKKKVAKVEAKGKATEDDLTSLDDIAKETSKKVAVATALTGVTIGAAIAILKKYKNRSDVESMVGDAENQISEPSANIENTPENGQFYAKASVTIATLVKDKVQAIVKAPMIIIDKIRNNKTEVEESPDAVTESVNFEDLEMFKYTVENCVEETTNDTDETVETESTDTLGVVEGLDLDAYFTELCDDLFTEKEDESVESEEITDDTTVDPVESEETDTDTETTDVDTDVQESTEVETEEMDAAHYLEQLEHEVLGDDEEVVEEETDDVVDSARTYMEQLEHEIFGDDEDVMQEDDESSDTESNEEAESVETEVDATEAEADVTESAEDDTDAMFKSLLDEMEALL